MWLSELSREQQVRRCESGLFSRQERQKAWLQKTRVLSAPPPPAPLLAMGLQDAAGS